MTGDSIFFTVMAVVILIAVTTLSVFTFQSIRDKQYSFAVLFFSIAVILFAQLINCYYIFILGIKDGW